MADIYIHNTLSRQKEKFTPIDASNVRMYVCGPTVYDFAHLGNARPVVVFDTLYRLLKRHYPRVTYVRNITDVDDKIMAKAKESGEPIDSITKRTTEAYHQDMAALNALPPDIEPRATQHIAQMIAMIQTLIEKGNAYVADPPTPGASADKGARPAEALAKAGGHVLFNVPSMKDYGRLSRRPMDEMIAGARVDVAPYKKDPADFVLWKPSAPDQPGWDSPWGRGRPGWHIECSAMAKEHLGITFDIHGGGLDLIFPHHENEIAQSSCAHGGAPLATIWMHNGFLEINKEKMAKSAGNFFTVRDLLAKFPGEAIRLALLSTDYKKPLDFSIEGLEQAKATLDDWYRRLQKMPPDTDDAMLSKKRVAPEVEEALSDDLNTHLAIKGIGDLFIMKALYTHPTSPKPSRAEILESANALGLLQQDPEAWSKWKPAGYVGLTDEEVGRQLALREMARNNKNYAEADRIRDTLAAQGVILEDGADGTTWRRG